MCDFVFKHKHEMVAVTGKTMFEKLQALGTKEAKSAFCFGECCKKHSCYRTCPGGFESELRVGLKSSHLPRDFMDLCRGVG